MAYAPIALTMPQYEDYANWYLKAYTQGTTTPLSMATDSGGGTTLAKSEIDANGFPTTDGSARFIPYINGAYDLWMFPTSAEADSNDTTNAIQLANNINADPASAITVTTVSYADNISALLAIDGTVESRVSMSGYHTAGDGGGGEFYWDASQDKANHNGGTIISKDAVFPSDWTNQTQVATWFTAGTGTGCWVRVYSGAVDVDWFGAKGDGATNDYKSIQSAATYCAGSSKELYGAFGKTFYVASQLDLRNVLEINILGDILTAKTITGVPSVLVGGFASSGIMKAKFGSVTNGDSTLTIATPADPILRLAGAKNAQFQIDECNYLQIYADESVTAEKSVAYSSFELNGVVRRLELKGAAGFSWINENQFYRGRIIELYVEGGGYTHNHNKFFFNTFEGSSVDIQFTNCRVNQIYGARFEGTTAAPGITFASDTYGNTVEYSQSGSGQPRNQFVIPIPVADSGSLNMVTSEALYKYTKNPLFDIGPNTQIISSATETVAENSRIAPHSPNVDNLTSVQYLTPGLKDVYGAFGFRYWALTEHIPVTLGDVVTFDADYDGNVFRTAVFCYDENLNILDTEGVGGVYWDQPSTTINATYGRYGPDSDLDAASVKAGNVARSEVKYIRVGVYSSTANRIRSFAAFLHTQNIDKAITERSADIQYNLRSIAGIPIQGHVPQSTPIYDRTATAMRVVTYQFETTLNGAVAGSGTSVTVTSAGSIANGDICGILLTDGTTHWSAISGLTGSTFTVTALPSGASSGARIVFNRWA